MADRYIDNREVVEYGRHFLREVTRLIGLSPLVDIAFLQQLVQACVDAMETALAAASQQQSRARVGRAGTAAAAAGTVESLRRFHYHLKALPREVQFDHEAFFVRAVMGRLDRLKPADLLARAERALAGFAAPANAGLPDAAEWQRIIETARDALAATIAGKQAATGGNRDATGSLEDIRLRFVDLYNNVAKRLVWALLAHTGRLDEYRRYFLDLQVNESGRGRSTGAPDVEAG